MSKSFKHTAIMTVCACKSQKADKRIANKAFRHRERISIASGYMERIPTCRNEVSDPWCFIGDGKTYFGNDNCDISKYMRK